MKITPINNYNSRPNFRAKLSYDAERELDDLGWMIEQEDGKKSRRYKKYEKDMEIVKNCCPEYKVRVKKMVDKYGFLYYDIVLKRFFQKPIYMGFRSVCGGEELFSSENLSVLSSKLQEMDEKENEENRIYSDLAKNKTNIFKKIFGIEDN